MNLPFPNSKWVLFLCVVFLQSSCQTLVSTDKTKLSTNQAKQFGSCWNPEGSVNFSAFKNEKPLFSAMLDWVREKNDSWVWEAYDPLGRTVLSGEVSHGKLYARGMDLSKLTIEKDGFLYYDGSNLAFKWKELHCFLNFQVPESWLELKLLTDSPHSQKLKHIRFEDKIRNIDLNFQKDRTCGSVTTLFLGMFHRERFTWCFENTKHSAYLNLENTFRFEWTRSQEKENEWTSYSK